MSHLRRSKNGICLFAINSVSPSDFDSLLIIAILDY
jgi:hypothetical protein